MKTFVVSALAVAALTGASLAQTVDYRWVERSSQTEIGPGAAPAATNNFSGAGSGSDATVYLVLEARVNAPAGSGIRGMAGFAGNVSLSDSTSQGDFRLTGSGRIVSAATSASAPGFAFPTAGGTNRGIFAPFRLVADLGEVATGVINDPAVGPNANIGQIVGATGGSAIAALVDGDATEANFGLGVFVPIYTFQYNVTDLTARALVITANLQASAFSTFDANNVPNSIALTSTGTATYTVSIVPAPGAAALLGLGGLLAARRRRA